jgi:APA family basic amino acid/polyamine antiporter
MAAPRVYFAMARDGLTAPAVASIHPRFGTPARAIALQAVLASVLAALGTFDQIVSYFIFVAVIFIALTVAALFVLRRTRPAESEYVTPGYPWTPGAFLFLATVLLILLGAGNPKQAFLGAAVVALGLPVYAAFFHSRLPGATSHPEDTTP